MISTNDVEGWFSMNFQISTTYGGSCFIYEDILFSFGPTFAKSKKGRKLTPLAQQLNYGITNKFLILID
jgi:hypothetical protein